MTRRCAGVIAGLSLLLVPGLARAQDAEPKPLPLDPLKELHATLQEGVKGFLAGEAPAEAFAPLDASGITDADRERLQKDGVRGAALVGFELELTFKRGGEAVYALRTLVHVGDGGVAFLGFRSRPVLRSHGTSGRRPEELTGAAEPVRKAVEGLLAALREQGPAAVPFLGDEELAALVTSPLPRREVQEDLDRSRKEVAQTCKAIAELQHDAVLVRLDDVALLALDGEGQATGVIKSEFRWGEDGRLGFALGRYRAFPPEAPAPEQD